MAAILEALARAAQGTMLEAAGLRFVEVNEQHALAEMAFRPELAQLTGLFHTGALVTLADSTATAACMYAVDPSGAFDPSTFPLAIQMSANMIRNTNAGTVTAEATMRHRGRTTMVVETTVRDERGRALLILTTTHLVLSGISSG